MDKNGENKLVNAIIDLHLEIKKQGENTDRHLAKINLALGEMRLSYMKLNERVEKLNKDINERINMLTERVDHLNDSFNKYAQRNDERVEGHETRISRLEEHNSGSLMFAKEPKTIYKKAKKKK